MELDNWNLRQLKYWNVRVRALSEATRKATSVCRRRAMAGNAGRYISFENGAMAVSEPRTNNSTVW
ncbi:MAG: hypothetical protein C4326_13040 [Ignavibacteria bacterium]